LVLRARQMEQSRAEYMSQWSKAGHFSVALSKGGQVTTWIWNLHSDAHDFRTDSVLRKVFSSNLAHLSLVFFWLGGMHFHGAYFANTSAWNKDPKNGLPGVSYVYSLVGQDILNSDVGGYFQAINVTSGFFQLWMSSAMIEPFQLKYGCTASLIGTIVCLFSSYFHYHTGLSFTSFYEI
jgi:photosystem I P700 chlorophyll a apoprotein A1